MFRNRESWLDRIVETFQHRWETNPQYRAAVSGFVGLALLITMCACTGVVSAAASAVLAGIGLGGTTQASGIGNSNTGTNRVTGAKTFPTATVVLAPGDIPGVSQLPDSQTPQPRPTATPTPPDQGGGQFGNCRGSQSTAVWAFGPCPLVHGQPGTLTIVDRDRKNAGAVTSGQIAFCADPACVVTLPADGSYHLDSTGRETISFTVPAQAVDGSQVSGSITITPATSGGTPLTLAIVTEPVQ